MVATLFILKMATMSSSTMPSRVIGAEIQFMVEKVTTPSMVAAGTIYSMAATIAMKSTLAQATIL